MISQDIGHAPYSVHLIRECATCATRIDPGNIAGMRLIESWKGALNSLNRISCPYLGCVGHQAAFEPESVNRPSTDTRIDREIAHVKRAQAKSAG